MYNKSSWKSHNGKYWIIKKYHSFRAQPVSCSVKERRARKNRETTLAQEEINARIRREKYEKLFLDNFKAGDCYLTCTYKEKPEGEEQVRNDWQKFKRKLTDLFRKKLQLDFKFVGIIEHLLGGGRPHGHILIPELPKEAIRKLKKMWPHGNVEIKTYGGEAVDAHRLAKYFCKESVFKLASNIQSSRNLIRTEEKKEIVSRSETFEEKTRVPAGYHVVAELSYSGYTEEGYPFTKVFLEKDDEEIERRKKRSRLHAANKVLGKQSGRKLATSESGI